MDTTVTPARDLPYNARIKIGDEVLTVRSAQRGRQGNRHVINVFFEETHPRTGRPLRTTFGLDAPVVVVTGEETPEPVPAPNPYVEKYGTPDDPTFVGQVIDSGGEFQFFPDGTLVLSENLGHTYRVVQPLHKKGREVIVSRTDGSTITIPEERFTTTDRDLTMLRLRVVYVHSDL